MSAESMTTDPYEVVLADLRAKKAQIEQAISAIEALRGGSSLQTSASASPGPIISPGDDVDSPGAFLGMSIADAAKKLLAAKRRPMRNPDIAAAFKRGGMVMNSKDVVNTIGSVLTRRANEVGDLVKVERGTWGLKEWYPNRNFSKPKAAAPESKEAAQADAVLFLITSDMRERLRKVGKSDDEINAMSFAQAQDLLELDELLS